MKMMFCVSRSSYMWEQSQCPNGSHVVFVKRAELDHMARGKKKDAEAGCI